jgi:hypothetical protein
VPQALLHKRGVNDSPAEVNHGRWGCPGIVAAKKLGWSQCEDFFCPHCPHGKVKRANIRRAPVPRVERVGALVCGDIIGPFPPSKTAGYRYAGVFTSAFGKMVHTYPLKTKDEFTTAFEDVCLKYRNAGHPIERFMTDSDSVMRGQEFRAAAHALSVECRYSSPYNQWQNGIVERMIK